MTKATAAKMQYIAEYETANYDKVLLRLPKGTKDRITATGATVNGFITNLVLRELESIGATTTTTTTTTDE